MPSPEHRVSPASDAGRVVSRVPRRSAVRALLVLVAAVVVAGGCAPPTLAAQPGDPRPVYLAEQLRRDPVYVSPSLARVTAADDVAALRREVTAMPYPTFVVLAPTLRDEPDVETSADLPNLLRDRVGRDGLYLVSDGDGIGFDAEAYGVRTRSDVGRLYSVVSDAVPTRDGPIARLVFALRYLRTGAKATMSVDAERAADDARPWWIFGISAALGFVVPVGLVAATPGARRRRSGRRALRDERRLRARPVPLGAAAPPDRDDARRSAQEALAGLARAIGDAAHPPDPALRHYDAASHTLSRRGLTAIDCLGAEALATAGRALLEGREWRPCLFDPRHGEGVRSTRWRLGADEATFPACAWCADEIAAGRGPTVLEDSGRPYWERDTVWARTGFGAIDDDLADLVLAGRGRYR
ncbi:hypothetical protein AB0L40_23340 [Patulibacter sp. NPDC049589]|uniref:hypothetical protein n=1 Tax=Patulibacter sp. NPDC049589 TaxID=3154731 RepID=UPI00344447C3